MNPGSDKALRLAAVLAAAAIGLVGMRALTASAAQSTHVARAISGLSLTRLLGVARATAAHCGDRNPTDIEAVRTTRGIAGQLIWPGAGVGSDRTPVYAITMRGKFTAYRALVPAGGFPTGSVISIVVRATGRQVGDELDFNLTRRPEPNLREAGPVLRLG